MPATPAEKTHTGPEPSWGRLLVVSVGIGAGFVGACALARAWAPAAGRPSGALVSAGLGLASMLVLASLLEWLVHRYLMHRSWRLLRRPFDLHHRAHHWVHYPPDAYLKPEVTYVPTFPPRPERLAATRLERLGAAWGQAAFYACFAVPVLAGGWLATANLPFVLALGAVCAGTIGLAVHVHDAVHCPGHSPLERFRWFWFLDHHHYLHHIDNQANTNFLLPLADWLLGTLRRELTPAEALDWPSYAEARRSLDAPTPTASASGLRAPTTTVPTTP